MFDDIKKIIYGEYGIWYYVQIKQYILQKNTFITSIVFLQHWTNNTVQDKIADIIKQSWNVFAISFQWLSNLFSKLVCVYNLKGRQILYNNLVLLWENTLHFICANNKLKQTQKKFNQKTKNLFMVYKSTNILIFFQICHQNNTDYILLTCAFVIWYISGILYYLLSMQYYMYISNKN